MVGEKTKTDLVALFCEKAEVVSAKIYEADDMKAAASYIAKVVLEKDPCELLAEEAGTEKGPLSKNGVPTRLDRHIALSGLPVAKAKVIEKECADQGIKIIYDGVRNYLAGFDASVAEAQFGIADSATCFVVSDDENMRLSTMMCEISFLFLDKKNIRKDLLEVASDLRTIQKKGPAYTAFITGPSRTADIERVLAIGAHGPLELHVILF